MSAATFPLVTLRPLTKQRSNQHFRRLQSRLPWHGCIMLSINGKARETVTCKSTGIIDERRHKVEPEGMPKMIEGIKAPLSMGHGEISISAYDTASVSLAKKLDGGHGPQFLHHISISYYFLVPILTVVYFFLKPSWKKTSIGSGGLALRLPPGPWKLPLIGSIHHLIRSSLVHHTLRDLSLRHGPLMFLKFGKIPVVVASTPDAAKELMKTHDTIFSTRPLSLAMKIMYKDGQGIAFTPNNNHWQQLRKICMVELLSTRRVLSFRRVREVEASRLVEAISSTTEPLVNIRKLVSMYVADTSVHTILGRRFKNQDTLLHKVDQVIQLAGRLTPEDLLPTSFLVRALNHRAIQDIEACQQSLFNFMDAVICEHLERKTDEEDRHQENMIDILLKIQQEGNLHFPLTMRTIEAVIFDLMGGGIESGSTTLHWAMAELMRNPAVMSKAQTEIRELFKGQMKVAEERLGELSYLQLIIKETLRLHPPGPLMVPRECQEQCRILGYDVPKGTMVLVNVWAIARNPDYWEEPDTFKPERFLGDTRDFKGSDFDFLPFGSGRRICPGMAFGVANIELALANLLFYFDWGLPEGVIPSELDMTETMGITARRKTDLLLSATPCVPLPS